MSAGMAPEHTSIGRWIKRLRADRELTQEALADQVACATQTIHAIEGGQRRPSRDLAERIATVLDVPTEQREAFVRLARTPAASQPVTLPAVTPAPVVAQPTPAEPARPRLPGAPNTLIGRQHEENDVRTLLGDATHRLVTLVGPGGAGKSRLALQIAHATAAQFQDGTVWISLAPVTAASQIPAAIATALGQTIGRTHSPLDEMIALVRDAEMLLVLDNFEHLLDGIEVIVALLQAAPRVRLLVTSRERLRLNAEHVVELDGLELPADDKPTTIVRSSAVLLFLERARQLDPTFALTPTNQHDVAQLCRLLHGMPLAIELAASWVRILSPNEILDEVRRSLDFLERGGRDATPRHRSLRAVFDYSWVLLSTDEQQALSRLAVFRGGCTREAARAVAGANAPILAALVDKSLVRRVESAGMSRFDLHELVRQFAEQRLREAGDVAATRTAHFEWMLKLAEDTHSKMAGPDALRYFTILETEHANMRHALEWGVDQPLIDGGLRMSSSLKRWWFHQGYFTEGREWYAQVLRVAVDAPPTIAKGRTLTAAGDLARWQGDEAQAITLLEEAVSVYSAIGEPLGIARTNLILAGIYLTHQDIAHAMVLSESSLAAFRAAGYERGISQALNTLGNILVTNGDLARARVLYQEQLGLVRGIGDITELMSALNNLGVVFRCSGDIAGARLLHEEALQLSESMQSISGMAWTTRNLGAVARDSGDLALAEHYFKRSLALRWETRERAGIVWAAEGLAEVAAARGDDERAITLWAAGITLLGPSTTAERKATEQHIAEVRARMNPERFDAAWAAGQAMSQEDLVRYGQE